MFKSGGWGRGGPQEWIRQLLAREKGRNFLVKQTSGVSARRSTGLGSVRPRARGREATRGKLHSARSCLSVRPAYRGVCVHAATSSKSCISGCVLLPHTCYGLSALNLSPEARPAPYCGADFSKRMTRRAFALGPFLPGGCHLVALFHSYGSGREPELHL